MSKLTLMILLLFFTSTVKCTSTTAAQDEIILSESDCSVRCGVGRKNITTVKVSSPQDKPEVESHEVPCDTGIKCDPTYEYTNWGDWTKCPSCIKTIDEISTLTR